MHTRHAAHAGPACDYNVVRGALPTAGQVPCMCGRTARLYAQTCLGPSLSLARCPCMHAPPLPPSIPDLHTFCLLSAAGYESRATDYKGLMALAKAQGVGNETRGACKLCGCLGHLTRKCTNVLSGHTAHTGVDEIPGAIKGVGGTQVLGLLPEANELPSDLSSSSSSGCSSDSDSDNGRERKRRRRDKKASKSSKKHKKVRQHHHGLELHSRMPVNSTWCIPSCRWEMLCVHCTHTHCAQKTTF